MPTKFQTSIFIVLTRKANVEHKGKVHPGVHSSKETTKQKPMRTKLINSIPS